MNVWTEYKGQNSYFRYADDGAIGRKLGEVTQLR